MRAIDNDSGSDDDDDVDGDNNDDVWCDDALRYDIVACQAHTLGDMCAILSGLFGFSHRAHSPLLSSADYAIQHT